jgi:hypothetical protein
LLVTVRDVVVVIDELIVIVIDLFFLLDVSGVLRAFSAVDVIPESVLCSAEAPA